MINKITVWKQLESKYRCCFYGRRFMMEQSLYRPTKEKYSLQYKVQVITPDGSSFYTRYHLPVGVIRLPIDPASLSQEQLKARTKKLRADKTVEVKEYKEDVKFDRKSLTRLIKRK